MTDYVINEKGDEVISERHQKDFKKDYETTETTSTETDSSSETAATSRFADVDFDDI